MLIRTRLLISILLLALVVAAACGRGQATVPTKSPVPGATETAEPTLSPRVNGSTPEPDGISSQPTMEALSTVDVVKILRSSVVQITTERLQMGAFNQPVPQTGVGTGIVLDEQGHILTNNHVIAGARTIMVTVHTGESFTAEVVGTDLSTDLAVIRIDAHGLQPATLGDSSKVEVGEDVVAIGHALGLPGGPTVSKGVVSALGRTIDVDIQTSIVDLIQTDASINPGNSGGPLANSQAEVIGIDTAIIPGTQAIGFAININDAKVVVAQLLEKGFVARGFLGITPFNLIPALANDIGVTVKEGIAVMRVQPGTGAEAAGLAPGDVIVQIGDEEIHNTGQLSKFLLEHLPGETVKVVYFRRQARIETEVTLGERPHG